MKSWRYVLQDRFEIVAPELAAVSYIGPWLQIVDGRLTISPGYAWDGCSPSIRLPGGPLLPGGIWLGTWDGPLGNSGRPVSWQASLVHDALCQFRADIQGLTKSATVQLFERMLREDGAPGWMNKLYPSVVSRLGPQEWNGQRYVTGV